MASNGMTVLAAVVIVSMVLASSMGAEAQSAPAPAPGPAESGVAGGLLPSFIASTLVGVIAFVAGGRNLW